MDPKLFYGNNRFVRFVPADNDSDDPDLSEDEASGPILVPDSNFQDIDGTDIDSDDSDDNISLEKLAEKLNPSMWRTGNLTKHPDEIKFTGIQNTPQELTDIETPYQFFKFLFTNEIISEMTAQTNLNCAQKRIDRPANISENEIEQFIGCCLYMSIIRLPQVRHYWSTFLGHPIVSSVMTCNRWEEIKRFLHFNDNEEFIPRGREGHDALFKVTPLLNNIRERLSLIPMEENVAVDEQIIPTKSRSTIKQYNPKKPHKWGYKVLVLSGISGFSYDFYIYAGSQSNSVPAGAPDLGTSSNVVVKFAEKIPKFVNHKIFLDNWFTSVPLMVYLTKNGILPLGTVRLNRVPGCQMMPEKELKAGGTGSFQEKTAIKDDVKMSLVCWYDNKVVSTLSTYVGSQPTGSKQRFFKSEKCHKMIDCPQSILKYNEYMGGVDSLDSMLGFYRIHIRSKKWYLRIFFHILDLCVVNSWLLWRRQSEVYMALADFKIAIADALCKSGKPGLTRKRGRPSAGLEDAYAKKKRRGPTSEIPQMEVRRDGLDHLPEWRENDRNRCKLPECKSQSYIYCTKCQVALCLNKDRNCFLRFHTE